VKQVERFMLLELVDGFELRFLCGKFIDFKMNIARFLFDKMPVRDLTYLEHFDIRVC
jgi:hypothetical protein